MHILFIFLLTFSYPVHAYIGPGLGLGVIGMIVGVLVSVLLFIVGVFWYPIKRMLRKSKTPSKQLDEKDSGKKKNSVIKHYFVGALLGLIVVFVLPSIFVIVSKNRTMILLELGLSSKPSEHIAEYPPKFAVQPVNHAPYEDSYLLLTGMFDKQNALRLIDHNGEVVKEYILDLENTEIGSEHNNFLTDVDDGTILPDGSALIVYGGRFFRIDRCKNIVFSAPSNTQLSYVANLHHSIFRTPRDTYWVPGGPPSYYHKGFSSEHRDQSLVELTEDAKIVRNIGLTSLFIKNKLYPLIQVASLHDIFHMNDIEELTPELAPAFPMFEAGDIIVSFRSLSMLIVVDPDTEVIKWWYRGEILKQHDPDFLPDGTILVFDNQTDPSRGEVWGGAGL